MDISALYRIYQQHPSVQTDTRKLQAGDLFFALKGPSFNGNVFAAQALAAGAVYAVVDEAEYDTDERCILVPDVLKTLQELAACHRQQLSIPIIAITGSNGKTTTKELITAVLQQQFITYATIGNLNNHIGVPLTLLRIKEDAQMAIVEMGANHLHEIESYCLVAAPDYGIITNCGKAHLEGFGGIDGVRKGKGELYDYLRTHGGTVFRNVDLDYLEQMATGIGQQITYGSVAADYTGRPVMTDVLLQVALQHEGKETILKTQLVGAYNFPNVMVAVAAGLHFGMPLEKIQAALAAYSPDNSRSQWLQRGSNHIISDAYNANPSSMKAAIENFAGLDLPNKILWLGAMKEMGNEETAEHKALVAAVAAHSWQDVVLVGKEFKGLVQGYHWFDNATDAAEYVKAHAPVNASILIKGSRGSKMETLLAALPE